jgi:hypothetical protein
MPVPWCPRVLQRVAKAACKLFWSEAGFQHREPDNVNWRLSIATMNTPAAFSHVPCVDRTLCVVEGMGVELNVNGVRSSDRRSVVRRFVSRRSRSLREPTRR